MKEYYYDKYMSQLRDKILELDQPQSPSRKPSFNGSSAPVSIITNQ